MDTRRESYAVTASNGRDEYTVTYAGSGDADPEYVALWDCTCPAAKFGHGGLCKHAAAVVAMLEREEDEETEV